MSDTRSYCIVLIMSLSIFSSLGCIQADDTIAGLGMIPDGDYNIVILGNSNAFLNSVFAKRIIEMFELSEKDMGLDIYDSIGLTFDDLGQFYLFIKLDSIKDILVFQGGPFTEENLREYLKGDRVKEISALDYMGMTYLRGRKLGTEMGYLLRDNGYYSGSETVIREMIKKLSEGHPTLMDNPSAYQASSLVDSDAQISFFGWGEMRMDPMLLFAMSIVQPSAMNDFARMNSLFEKVSAWGVSCHLSDALTIRARINLKEESIAVEGVEKIKELKQNLTSLLSSGFMLNDQPSMKLEVLDLLDRFKFSRSGKILSVEAGISASSALWDMLSKNPLLSQAMEKQRQDKSAMAIASLGKAVDRYIAANPAIGCPKAKTIDELLDILSDSNVDLFLIDDEDGWDNKLKYEFNTVPGSTTYRIISFGSDGQPGPPPVIEGIVTNAEEDIVWENGKFIQKPLSN